MKTIVLIDPAYHVIPFNELNAWEQQQVLAKYPDLFTSDDPLYVPDGLVSGLVYDELELWRFKKDASSKPKADITWRNLMLADWQSLSNEDSEIEIEVYQ